MTITNTSATASLLDAMPGMIEASERRGQSELVHSDQLPANMGDKRPSFERLGFRFGDPTPGDPLFIQATLPPGWSKRGTDHAMHSVIVDDAGRERVSIFYKAAFYDRRADMCLKGRYMVDVLDWEREVGPKEAQVTDLKTGQVIHSVTREAGPEKWDSANSNARSAAYAWLDANRPHHRDPMAWLED